MKSYILDMDGVLVRGRQPIPGAQEFIGRLEEAGARFIATNPDPSGPSEKGIETARGAMAALIEKAIGVTREEDIAKWPYRSTRVLPSVADIEVD